MKGSSYDWKNLKSVDQKLLEALKLKQFAEVDRLIKEGADVNVSFGPGDSALHYFEDVDIIEKLLKNGANVNQNNSYSETPLMHAVSYYKHVEVVKVLLIHGANVNVSNRRRNTPLDMALRSSYFNRGDPEKTIKTFLEFGTRLTVKELCYPERISKLLIKFSMINENVIVPTNVIQSSKPEYVVFVDECRAEVNLLDSCKFNNSLSLLDIIKNWRRWLPNLSIMKLLNDYEQTYPIYGDFICDRIHAVILERRKLLSQLDMMVVSAKRCEIEGSEYAEVLDMDCKRHIMKFVSNKDVESFLSGTSETDDSEKDLNDPPNAKRVKFE